MKEVVSRNIYLISLIISFVAGLIALNATFGLYVSCDTIQGFESLGCILGYIYMLVVIAPFIALLSLFIRLFAKKENKRWEDIYIWAFFIILFSLFNYADQEIPSGVLKLVIYVFVFLFLTIPFLIFIKKLRENKSKVTKISTKKLTRKKLVKKISKKPLLKKKRK